MKIGSWWPYRGCTTLLIKHAPCFLQIRVICRCPDCNQDLQVMAYELFLSHCYSASSPITVCSLKGAVSSIKPAFPIPTLSTGSTKHEEPALHQELKETGVSSPPSTPLTICGSLHRPLWLKPSHRYKEVPEPGRGKVSRWTPFLLWLPNCLSATWKI